MIASSIPATSPKRSTLTTLERRLHISSDSPDVMAYVHLAYSRALTSIADEEAVEDNGSIEADIPLQWLRFNGAPVDYPRSDTLTIFRRAFYGVSKLIRLSLQQNLAWHSLHGAALCVGEQAIVLVSDSGIAKTTLALELMARGATFMTDEFVCVRKQDALVSGVWRALVIRARMLEVVRNARLRAMCASSQPRSPRGDPIWDGIDPVGVFGPAIIAQPAPLGAAIVLERNTIAGAVLEPMPASLAAATFARRMNLCCSQGFERFVTAAQMLNGVPCYRVASQRPQLAAEAICQLLR